MALPKAYEPNRYESDMYKLWEEQGVFKADPTSDKPRFSIAMPPPNETGTLHVGQALGLTLQDIMGRRARQQGCDVLLLHGTDHAALPVNMLMIKQLEEQGTTKEDIGREEFIKRTKQFVGSSRDTINKQVRAMGAGVDWSRLRYTLDDTLNRCVNEVFTKMYHDGLIYRGHRLVNWDPKLETTVSDDELVHQEQKTPLYTLQFGPFQIATARPETKFGDKYVVMHPNDKRYQQYKHGQTLEVDWLNGPLTATVIKDEAVEPEFGTGVMTITPWHDRTDFEIAERHGLEKEQIIGFDGRLLPIAQQFAGQTIDEARPKIVAMLKDKGLLVKIDEDYVHSIALNDRGKGVIEPQIKLQWFVDVNRPAIDWKGQKRSFKEVMRAVIEDDDIKLTPKRFEKLYFHWIDNLRDWCISRQIWWGHQVPVWYKRPDQPVMGYDQTVMNQMFKGKTKTYRQKDYGYKVGDKILVENSQSGTIFGEITLKSIDKTTVGEVDLQDKAHYVIYQNQDELIAALKKYHPEREMGPDYPIWVYEYDFEPKEVEPEIYVGVQPPKGAGWERDPDTLDTWFSSALWTWSTLVDPRLAEDYSLNLAELLKQSQDFQTYHPTSVMETAWDILFFWVARMILATTYATGQVPFKDVYLHGLVRTPSGKKMSKSDPESNIDPLTVIEEFGTDALRMALAGGATAGNDQKLGREDIMAARNFANKLWNVARYIESLGATSEDVDYKVESTADHWILNMLSITAGEVGKALENFRFDVAYDKLYHFVWDDLADWYIEAAKVQANPALARVVLEKTLLLLHPFAPFVTEAIWQTMGGSQERLLAAQVWQDPPKADARKAEDFEAIKQLVSEIRRIKNALELNKPNLKYSGAEGELIEALAGLGAVEPSDKPSGLKLISGEAWLDIDAQTAQKYLEKLKQQADVATASVERLENRLKDKNYTEKAPAELVDETKAQLAEAKAEAKTLFDELAKYQKSLS